VKRDWDLIRAVLTQVEAKAPGQFLSDTEVSGWSLADVRGHIAMLKEAGYLDARVLKGTGPGVGFIQAAQVAGLTYQGADLLDMLRSESVWQKTKALAKEKGIELTLDSIKALAKIALDIVLKGGIPSA
jgi:hypothetical protein